jgi:hypothetical protein
MELERDRNELLKEATEWLKTIHHDPEFDEQYAALKMVAGRVRKKRRMTARFTHEDAGGAAKAFYERCAPEEGGALNEEEYAKLGDRLHRAGAESLDIDSEVGQKTNELCCVICNGMPGHGFRSFVHTGCTQYHFCGVCAAEWWKTHNKCVCRKDSCKLAHVAKTQNALGGYNLLSPLPPATFTNNLVCSLVVECPKCNTASFQFGKLLHHVVEVRMARRV